jgi:SAM-dependent methyltransferase
MVDFGRTAQDYASHRVGFPPVLFDWLAEYDVVAPGWRVLDLGTGTGSLARGLALAGADVTGLDPSEAMLEAARGLDAAAGATVDYRLGRAEETGLPVGAFDAVTAGQCWHWFDRPQAGREAYRLLRPGGRLAIAHFDWIPLPGNVADATERLIELHNPAWTMGGGTGIHPDWLADAAIAGFIGFETRSVDRDVPYGHEAWRGRIRASAGVGASLSADRIAAFDRALAELLVERFPAEPLAVLHRLWVMVAVKPG